MELPPGPRLPRALQTAAWITRPKPFLRRAHAELGDVFTMQLAYGERVVVLAHPDAVKEVFTGPPDVLRAGEGNRILLPILGRHSVLLLDGPQHLRHRRLMLPAFHGERLRAYEQVMVEAAERAVARWPAGEPLRLAGSMQDVTLEVIMRTVFGVRETGELARLREVLLALLEWTVDPWKLVVFGALARRGGTIPPLQRVLAPVDRALRDVIAQRRAAGDLAERDDVLSMLLQARDEDGQGLTDAELRDELVTLLIAGHETTANALSWTFERLMRHPEALERAVADAREDAEDGAYLDAVAKETLRLRPILPMVARHMREPMTIAGYDLPAGTVVTPAILLVHHRPELYPEPDAFRPERFLGVTPGTYEWLPFGGGVRRCLGASFALFEMRVILRTVLGSVDLRALDPAGEPTARRAITLTPARGALARVAPTGVRERVAA